MCYRKQTVKKQNLETVMKRAAGMLPDLVLSREAGTLKRHADWLEKMSVAAFAVGIFQRQVLGAVIGILCYFLSLYLTKKIGGRL